MSRFFTLMYLVTSLSGTLWAADRLSDAAHNYESTIAELLDHETDSRTRDFLANNLTSAHKLDGLADSVAEPLLQDWKDHRLDTTLQPGIVGTPTGLEEQRAWNKWIAPFLRDGYFAVVEYQNKLLERKYFESETSSQANFLEAYLNGVLPFTRSDPTLKPEASPTLGISPWEVIARFEPVVVDWDLGQPAFIGLLGLNGVLFPKVITTGETINLEDNFFSKYVQKLGIRGGAGVTWIDSHPHLLWAAGGQIASIAIWAVYEPDFAKAAIGIGMADLSVLKNFLPYIGK